MPLATQPDVVERIRKADDPGTIVRVALEASLDLVGAERGLVALVDRGNARLYSAFAIGLGDGESIALRPARLAAKDPLFAVARDGAPAVFGPDALARPPLSRLRRLGLAAAVAVPLVSDTVVSPCLSAGRCLSSQCLVRERTASASPDEEWVRRVSAACVRGTAMRARGVLVLDASRLPGGERRRELDDIAQAAGRSLQRFPETFVARPDLPARQVEEEWIRRAFGAVADPLLVVDAQGKVRFANGHARRLFFARPSDSEGRRRAVDFNRMLVEAWVASYLKLRESERTRELSLVDPEEGSELLFELLTSTAHNTLTRETGTVVVMKDVSDIRHAVEELESTLQKVGAEREAARRERDQLTLVLEGIDQPIVVAEPSGPATEGVLAGGVGEIVRMNRAAKRLLQASRGASERERDLVRRNDAIVTSLLSQASIAGGGSSAEVSLADPPTGDARASAATVGVARDRLGSAAAVVCVLADLSELRELERRRVEQQLFESEKLAATGRLAASFAHEINNPLEAMKNALYLLVQGHRQDDPHQQYLKIIHEETDRISGIVRMILGFYRPSILREPTDLNAIVKDVIELMRQQMRQARVVCHAALDPGLPQIVASPDQLKQVFLNLLLNATQAMPTGGEIHLTTRRARQEGAAREATGFVGSDAVVVEVRDDGAGLAPEAQVRLFEPFFSTKKSGTGLGLWVCREIVQAHGGTIRLASRPSAGTTVTVVLPIEAKERAA